MDNENDREIVNDNNRKSINLMSIITRFLSVVTEPQFKLAYDLTSMVIVDEGQVTQEKFLVFLPN